MNTYRIVAFVLLVGLAAVAGCGDPPLNTAPLTEEQKQKIREDDKRIDDEERGGAGKAVPPTKGKPGQPKR